MIDAAFWRGKRVFLTGHTGFKGAWLSLWLQRLGADVHGFSLDLPSSPSLFEAARIGAGMTDRRGDICDPTLLADAMKAAAPDIVMHLAAQSIVRTSYADPISTFNTNVMGTVHVLDAVRRCPTIRAVLIVTSDKCYENREWIWGYRETDPMGGYDPYSASKGAAEIVTASMRRSFFAPEDHATHRVAIATARSGNVIGGGDWSVDRIVPDIVRAFSQGSPVLIRNPRAIRPWQFVLDPLGGYLRLCERLWHDGPAVADGWNFGPAHGAERPVADLAKLACDIWGPGASLAAAEGPAPHEATFLKLDASKAHAGLGWSAKFGFDDAVRMTISWYRGFYSGDDPRSLTERQIDQWNEAE